jgi:hypothetical protein
VKELQDPAVRAIVAQVLDADPDGPSLFAEAGHWCALAQQSAAVAAEAAAEEKAARRRYEALLHRLDPRHDRTLHFVVALAALAAVITALLVLDRIEFAGVLTGWMAAAAAVMASATWAGCAWLAGLAVREQRHSRLIAIAVGASAAGLLLAALHSTGSAVIRWPGWDPTWVGALLVLFILALVTIATEIMTHTEPASLLLARHRWHQVQRAHEDAARVQRSDAEAAAVAAQNWCDLVDIYATAYAASHADADGAAAGTPPAGNGHFSPDPWSGMSPM